MLVRVPFSKPEIPFYISMAVSAPSHAGVTWMYKFPKAPPWPLPLPPQGVKMNKAVPIVFPVPDGYRVERHVPTPTVVGKKPPQEPNWYPKVVRDHQLLWVANRSPFCIGSNEAFV